MSAPRSLAMIKMEKNFRAVIEKGYPRKPYLQFPVHSRDSNKQTLYAFVNRENAELKIELDCLVAHLRTLDRVISGEKNDFLDEKTLRKMIVEASTKAQVEVADVINCLEYLFEGLEHMKEAHG